MSVNINHQLEQVNNLKITAVGTGATVGSAGIVTYYGDGSQLSGISGGGGDAATLDGLDSLSFLRSDFADQKTVGDLRFNNNIGLTFGGSDNSRLFHDGTDLSLDLTAYVTDFKIRDGTTERYTFTKAGQLSLVDVNASGIVTATSFV
ncbi:hypothetical protein CMO86_05190, partial [Candidatus Woesearchaeota archaeon]|nr:hypothetical protein [Candidatus Woesearchaeota archaeon]